MKRQFPRLVYRAAARVLTGTGITRMSWVDRLNRAVVQGLRSSIVEIDGHRIHLDPHDSLGLSALGHFEPAETALIKDTITSGMTVVDIGANLGYFTLIMARQTGPDGHVYAFEPDESNFDLLQRNIEENGYTNVTLIKAGVSNATTTGHLFRSTINATDHRIVPLETAGDSRSIDLIRLDDFLVSKSPKVDFIKMDIQGAEGLALEGMSHLLQHNPAIQLLVEFWPYGLRRCGSDPEGVLERLTVEGFTFFEVQEHERMVIDASSILQHCTMQNRRFKNLYCIRPTSKD